MIKTIQIPEKLLIEAYKYLVLYALLHGIGDSENYNTFLKEIEDLLPEDEKY